MLSKCYISSKVCHRTWLDVPLGTYDTRRDIHNVVGIQTRDFCYDGYTILNSESISNMDLMRFLAYLDLNHKPNKV